MSALGVVILIVAILAANVVLFLGATIWVGRRLRKFQATLRARLAPDERLLAEPAVGNYRGASARFGKVKGVAMIALTDRRLLVEKALGAHLEVPLSEVVDVRADPWFLRSSNRVPHIILELRDGVEVGFQVQVRDHARWLDLVRSALTAPPASTG